nr:hypothetical protein [Acinetobacter sp. Marseille-Q1620]
MKEIIIAITVGVLTGAFTPVFYYHFIEKPKLNLEVDKLKLETFKSFTSFIPKIDTQCTSNKLNYWNWEIRCNIKNSGDYPVNITLNNIKLGLAKNVDQITIGDDQYSYKCSKKSYLSSPGSNSYIGCNIYLNHKKYPNGVVINAAEAYLDFQFKTDESTQVILESIDNIKGLSQYVKQISNDGVKVIVALQ